MLSRFLSCRERFRLKCVCGLEPHDKWNHRLGYGNMWHTCEESLAAGRHHFDALAAHSECMCVRYPLQRAEITKWHNVCCVQFPEYVEHWDSHPDVRNRTPLMQEQVFDVPYELPSGRTVRLRGKWDSVDLITDDVSGPSGGIYLQENKTKGDVDKLQIERQLKFDLQTMVYLIALREYRSDLRKGGFRSLSVTGSPVLGVRYNVVRRPLSGGRGTIVQHKARGSKAAETEAEFYERLRRDYITADPDYWFFRVRSEVSERDIDVFRKTCLDPLLETLCWWYEEIILKAVGKPFQRVDDDPPPTNYRTPFGVYSALEEGGATEYDAYLETGSESGLRRVHELFTELA